jgi:hypothetical protein
MGEVAAGDGLGEGVRHGGGRWNKEPSASILYP